MNAKRMTPEEWQAAVRCTAKAGDVIFLALAAMARRGHRFETEWPQRQPPAVEIGKPRPAADKL